MSMRARMQAKARIHEKLRAQTQVIVSASANETGVLGASWRSSDRRKSPYRTAGSHEPSRTASVAKRTLVFLENCGCEPWTLGVGFSQGSPEAA